MIFLLIVWLATALAFILIGRFLEPMREDHAFRIMGWAYYMMATAYIVVGVVSLARQLLHVELLPQAVSTFMFVVIPFLGAWITVAGLYWDDGSSRPRK